LAELDPEELWLDRVHPGVVIAIEREVVALREAAEFTAFIGNVLDEGLQVPMVSAYASGQVKGGKARGIADV
jgi:hypothetical protein